MNILICSHNYLTILPKLNNIEIIDCSDNNLYILPELSSNIDNDLFYYHNNPIYSIIGSNNIPYINKSINTINKFRYIYYCLKFKIKFRYILYEKIRKPKIILLCFKKI
jgi:hypothetical protein